MIPANEIKELDYFSQINWSEVKTERYWYEQQPVVTHFFNALSLAIPETERFLVKTIKLYQAENLSKQLTKDLKRFIDEENVHSLQHTRFNNDLKRHQYPVKFALKFSRFGYRIINKIFSKKTKLAITVGLEHMTAVLASYGFDNEIMKENISEVYDLFIWHAFEELNHRSVAFDLYKAMGGGYLRRILAMIYVTFIFFLGVFTIQWSFILTDLMGRRGIKLRHFSFATKFFLGRKGMLWGCLKSYFSAYKPSFKP